MEGVGRLYNEDQICWWEWRARANMYEKRSRWAVRDIKARLAQAKRQQISALLFLDFPESFIGHTRASRAASPPTAYLLAVHEFILRTANRNAELWKFACTCSVFFPSLVARAYKICERCMRVVWNGVIMDRECLLLGSHLQLFCRVSNTVISYLLLGCLWATSWA